MKSNDKNCEVELLNSKKVKLRLDNNNDWIGDFFIDSQKEQIELSIEINEVSPDVIEIGVLNDFLKKIDKKKAIIFSYIKCSLENSGWEKSMGELEKMYYLSGITVKKEKLWIVLEPQPHVTSIYNFFPRFTFKNSKIIWCNLKK